MAPGCDVGDDSGAHTIFDGKTSGRRFRRRPDGTESTRSVPDPVGMFERPQRKLVLRWECFYCGGALTATPAADVCIVTVWPTAGGSLDAACHRPATVGQVLPKKEKAPSLAWLGASRLRLG
jgi:hypothetical protein